MRQIIPFNAHANPFFGEFFRRKIRENDPRDAPPPSALTEVFAVCDSAPSADKPTHSEVIDGLLRRDFSMLESGEDRARKENALIKLNAILHQWMQRVHAQLGINVNELEPGATNHFARLVCYGSYKLGVSGPSGDIDTLVLAPLYVERDAHFFGVLFPLLRELGPAGGVEDLNSVNERHSYTPLISMCFHGVEVDMVFATLERVDALDGRVDALGLAERPNLDNDELTRHMDEKMKSSYNGFRNAEMMLNAAIVGCENSDMVERRINSFRTLLRCVKRVAHSSGIAQNKAGFLAGITLALLSVKAVQLFPNYSAPYLLERFFHIFGTEWDWDNWRVLVAPEKAAPTVGFRPEFAAEKRYMYVLTPAHPATNSTYNVRFSTRETILSAFRTAHARVLRALAFKHVSEAELLWRTVFQAFPFFESYEQYIEIAIVGNDAQLFIQWRGFVESKVKFLVRELEKLLFYFEFEMRLWPITLTADDFPRREGPTDYAHCERLYVGLTCKTELAAPLDLTAAVSAFVNQLEADWQHERGRDATAINLLIHIVDRESFRVAPAESAQSVAAEPEIADLSENDFIDELLK